MDFHINGRRHSLEPQPGEMLADLLRKRLGLTGTKIGCNEAECGACTVLIDGEPILSCTYPAAKAAGKQILTIEGLANINGLHQDQVGEKEIPLPTEKLHPLQEAFILHGAVQCGFCIPGQLMTSYALLLRNSDPSEEDIRHTLKDTLCRCAGYPTIIRSIQAAAQAMQTHEPVRPPNIPLSAQPEKVIGEANNPTRCG